MKIIITANPLSRQDIPEIAELYIGGKKITHVPVRTSWIDRTKCLKCGLLAENGYHGELNCFCYTEKGALLVTTFTLRQARINARKELREYASALFAQPRTTYYAVTRGSVIPSVFRFGPKSHSILATAETPDTLIANYDSSEYTIWEIRPGGAMRDYVTAYYTGNK